MIKLDVLSLKGEKYYFGVKQIRLIELSFVFFVLDKLLKNGIMIFLYVVSSLFNTRITDLDNFWRPYLSQYSPPDLNVESHSKIYCLRFHLSASFNP